MTVLSSMLFLSSLFALANMLLGIHYQNKKVSIISSIFVLSSFVILNIKSPEIVNKGYVAFLVFLSILVNIECYRSNLHISTNVLNNNSIAESLEKLPVGVCYFTDKGLLKYCNEVMAELVYELQGKDIQAYKEVCDALENPNLKVKKIEENVYEFKNKKIYAFDKNETILHGKKYYQIIARDLTDIVTTRKALSKSNQELEKMLKEVEYISSNIAEITRQQELLNVKIRIHNKMGNCLLAIRQYLTFDKEEEKRKYLEDTWKDSLNSLLEENEEEENPFDELVRIGKNIGIEVKIEGSFPKEEDIAYLLIICLRECIVNAKRHAKASEVRMNIVETKDQYITIFENNGQVPSGAIKKGGGLSNLENKIRAKKGNMTISHIPCFSLRVQLPKDIIHLDL